MTEKNAYWVRNLDGNVAHLIGAEQRDRWANFGYTESAEPGDTDFVWMRHPELADPARIPWGARGFWQAQGFQPAAPPEPVDPTRDPDLVDPPAEAVPPTGKPAMAAAKTVKE